MKSFRFCSVLFRLRPFCRFYLITYCHYEGPGAYNVDVRRERGAAERGEADQALLLPQPRPVLPQGPSPFLVIIFFYNLILFNFVDRGAFEVH